MPPRQRLKAIAHAVELLNLVQKKDSLYLAGRYRYP